MYNIKISDKVTLENLTIKKNFHIMQYKYKSNSFLFKGKGSLFVYQCIKLLAVLKYLRFSFTSWFQQVKPENVLKNNHEKIFLCTMFCDCYKEI